MESTSKSADSKSAEFGALVPAAVLVPLLLDGPNSPRAKTGWKFHGSTGLIDIPANTEVLFTVRTQLVEHHKGQISFPGGARDPSDRDLRETALRESEEEIGLPRSIVEVIGQLPTVPTVATHFTVSPFVGLIRERPRFKPNADEIVEIFSVPLWHLLDKENSAVEMYERNGVTYQLKSYYFGSHRIWGATGVMLQHLLEKFK